jgi:hypothetical protein
MSVAESIIFFDELQGRQDEVIVGNEYAYY